MPITTFSLSTPHTLHAHHFLTNLHHLMSLIACTWIPLIIIPPLIASHSIIPIINNPPFLSSSFIPVYQRPIPILSNLHTHPCPSPPYPHLCIPYPTCIAITPHTHANLPRLYTLPNMHDHPVKKFFFFYSIFSSSVTTTLRVYIRIYFLF